jgi:hypothetical protein
LAHTVREVLHIKAAMDFFDQEPVVHTWTYKLDKAA